MVVVDRRGGPGGHWLDVYEFVRLHIPSAYYGVNSLALGEDRIDEAGENAGFYERATGEEVRELLRRGGRAARADRAGAVPHRARARGARDGPGSREPASCTRSRFAGRWSTRGTSRRRCRPRTPRRSRSPPARASCPSTISPRSRPRRSRSSGPARPRSTPARGCSTTTWSRSGSAGSGRATPGSTTAATSSRWSRSAASWRASRSTPRPAPRRPTSTISSTGSRLPGGSSGSIRRGRRRCIAARCSATTSSAPAADRGRRQARPRAARRARSDRARAGRGRDRAGRPARRLHGARSPRRPARPDLRARSDRAPAGAAQLAVLQRGPPRLRRGAAGRRRRQEPALPAQPVPQQHRRLAAHGEQHVDGGAALARASPTSRAGSRRAGSTCCAGCRTGWPSRQ